MRKLIPFVVMLALVGCGEAPVTLPGANDNETTTQDDSCASNANCKSTEVCVQSQCTLATGREFVFKFISAKLPEKKADGSSWDVPGGLPDPFVELVIDEKSCTTSTKDNTLSPAWNEECVATIHTDSKIRILIGDEDLSDHDLVADSGVADDAIAFVRLGDGAGYQGKFDQAGRVSDFRMSVLPR